MTPRRALVAAWLFAGTAALAAPAPQATQATQAPQAPQATQAAPAPQATMSDGTNIPSPATSAPGTGDAPASTAPSDRRPFYLGAGLLAFAVIFWWNRKQRRALDAEDADARTAGRERVRRVRTRARASDADADDLHAAAAGPDAPDAPDSADPEVPDGHD